MDLNGLTQQQTLNFTPNKRTTLFGTPDKETTLFGTPDEGTAFFRTLDEGTAFFRTTLFETPNEGTSPAIKNEEEFVPTNYICSPMSPIKSAGPLNPLNDFCLNLVSDGIFAISPQAYQQPTSPPSGEGSFFLVHPGKSPITVQKVADIGSNNSKKDLGPKPSRALMTKTDFLALLDAIRRSDGTPQVVKTYEMYFSHVSKDNGVLAIVQEECSPLPQNIEGLIGLIHCIIALYRADLPVSDVKPANFMVTAEGLIVCVDLDLRKMKNRVYKLVTSGEYTHTIEFDVSEQFKQLILVFLETLGYPIVGERKSAFRALYQQKGLLQSYSLLSSDRSVYETTLDDFHEVLRKIGLSEEDIAYLVGLIVPPASSQ